MSNEMILIVGLAGPVALLTILRINAAMVFLSLCLGSVLVHFVAGNGSNSVLSLMSAELTSQNSSLLQLFVLFLPAVLTCVFMLFSVQGQLKVLLNILPALGVGLLTVLLAVPMLPGKMPYQIQSVGLWQQITEWQPLLVTAFAGISLFFAWSMRRHHTSHKESK